MWSPLPTWTTPWLEVRTSCLLPTLLSFNPVKGPRPTTTFHRHIPWLSVVLKKSIGDQSPDSYLAKEYQDKYGLHFLRTQLLPYWHIVHSRDLFWKVFEWNLRIGGVIMRRVTSLWIILRVIGRKTSYSKCDKFWVWGSTRCGEHLSRWDHCKVCRSWALGLYCQAWRAPKLSEER